jgi:hypothetical protein
MIPEEVEGEEHSFGVFCGREVAMATADDNVVDVWNPGCIEGLLEFDGLGGIDGMVAIAVDDEGGWNAGADVGDGGHLAGAGKDGGSGLGPARGLAARSLDGSGVVVVGCG